jgi:hypothetical protein
LLQRRFVTPGTLSKDLQRVLPITRITKLLHSLLDALHPRRQNLIQKLVVVTNQSLIPCTGLVQMPPVFKILAIKEISFGSMKFTSISKLLVMLSLPKLEVLRVSDVSDNLRWPELVITLEDETQRKTIL